MKQDGGLYGGGGKQHSAVEELLRFSEAEISTQAYTGLLQNATESLH